MGKKCDLCKKNYYKHHIPNILKIMRRLFITACILLITPLVFAQGATSKHVVFLTDKNNNPYTLSNPSEFLTQRSLDRRTRYVIPLDMKDLPVTPSYVTQIAQTGAVVVYPLKWFNAVVISTDDPTILAAIAAFPFVDHIDMVSKKNPVTSVGQPAMNGIEAIPPYSITKPISVVTTKSTSSFDYGQAANQTQMIHLDLLHDLGFSGFGMWIAILDAGFYHADQIPAFDSLWINNQILGTRDFSIPGNNVFGDNMHWHGMSVLSTMGANLPGQMVGTAPHASFWLIRTEVAETESLVEEYNWAGGAEFADSLGVDVINSSLGYTTFDNPVYNHTYADMDGNTTPITRAADLATSRGMIVVNSAGNEGGSAWQYIGAPADGDSVFSIGAVDSQGNYASFSSTGPTADGRIKPDVVAQGEGTTVIWIDGSVVQGSGTSFSSPIMAGAMACLWQSLQEYSAEDLRNAVRSTASQANSPDSLLGYGIPNMMNALTVLSVPSPLPVNQRTFMLYPIPFTGSPWLQSNLQTSEMAKIDILSVTGQRVSSLNLNVNGSSTIKLDAFNALPSGLYFVRINGTSGQQMIRAVKL
jgi:serine protease AprX